MHAGADVLAHVVEIVRGCDVDGRQHAQPDGASNAPPSWCGARGGTSPTRASCCRSRAFRDGLRFGSSMLLRSLFSVLHGRYVPDAVAAQFDGCFSDVQVPSAFAGLALVATARR